MLFCAGGVASCQASRPGQLSCGNGGRKRKQTYVLRRTNRGGALSPYATTSTSLSSLRSRVVNQAAAKEDEELAELFLNFTHFPIVQKPRNLHLNIDMY